MESQDGQNPWKKQNLAQFFFLVDTYRCAVLFNTIMQLYFHIVEEFHGVDGAKCKGLVVILQSFGLPFVPCACFTAYIQKNTSPTICIVVYVLINTSFSICVAAAFQTVVAFHVVFQNQGTRFFCNEDRILLCWISTKKSGDITTIFIVFNPMVTKNTADHVTLFNGMYDVRQVQDNCRQLIGCFWVYSLMSHTLFLVWAALQISRSIEDRDVYSGFYMEIQQSRVSVAAFLSFHSVLSLQKTCAADICSISFQPSGVVSVTAILSQSLGPCSVHSQFRISC